ncbi:MAG: EAL domain-containing protein, partial [Pseudomonadota bacterium]
LFFRNVSIAFDNLNLQSNLVREVDTRKRKEEENAVLASIPADAPMPVMRISNEGKLIYANDASSPLVKEWDVEVGEDVPDVVAQILEAALEGREPIEFEIPCEDRTLEAVLSPVPNSRFANVYCKDVTDTKKAQAELRHLATHDPLTQLPNRTLFLDHLQAEMAAARRSGALVGVSFLDLDNFKVINDTLGHSAGDDLLRQVSDRLTASVRSGDIVARMGGDEFAILQSRIKAPEAAERQARRIIQALNEPVSLDGRPIQVGCSIGITTYPTDGKSSARLQQNADMAMYLAKSKGRNGFRFYDSDLDERLRRERELEEAMVDGLKNSEFEVHYQPKIDLRNGTVIGAEALLRWIRKDEGFVSPGEFIPAAERSGFITDLGAWVLVEACEQFARWLRQDLNVGTIAVNLSPAQFRDRDLTTLVDHTIGSTGLPPEKLELEITESLAMEEVEETAEVMERLKASGVGLAIDDFGTGHSSLSYLRKLPFTALKIDRSFILDVDENEDASSIVQTIVSLGRNMGMRVVAEGIERNSQAERLKTFGCDEAQGFLYSRAIQSSDFEKFLINQAKKDRT